MSTEASEVIASIPPIPDAMAAPAVKRGPGRPRKETPSAAPDMFAKTTTTTAGDSLIPDASMMVGVQETGYWYWVGLTEDAHGLWSLHCAGITFPKIEFVSMSVGDGDSQRYPMPGSLVRISEERMERMRADLRRTVLRSRGKPGGLREDDSGAKNVGKHKHEGHWLEPIRIPTKEEAELAKANGMPKRRYDPQPTDIPAANVMFAQLCSDQSAPARGAAIPKPLSVTGLTWPVEI